MALPMTRAPTQVTCSLLKIVLSADGISLISPAQKPAAFPFGYRRIGRPHFQESHPGAGAGRPLYTSTQISVNAFPSTTLFPGRSDNERRRIIGLQITVSTVVDKKSEISFSTPRVAPLKGRSQVGHNHPERPCLQGFGRLLHR